MICKHETWTRKKRCGMTNPAAYYVHCTRCGAVRFGMSTRNSTNTADKDVRPKSRVRL